ncbi:hypothetical protein OAO01_07830, partial [Oligoflexia bacterium]|nr:hypothetical protein [Oligoflexia bacterium]
MSITINSNIASLSAQRYLGKAQTEVSKTFERLSSGLRVNKASDDAAGLSVASQLHVDTRVYNQGIRNLNDGLSLLNIADGALGQLSAVVTRQLELATQAANGTFTNEQRRVLDAEAQALRNEYRRIVDSTEFNGRQVFDGSSGTIRIQAGYGLDEGLALGVSGIPSSISGDGTFQALQTYAGNNWASDVVSADFDGDGNMDLVISEYFGGLCGIMLGNGDGTFQAKSDVNPGSASSSSLAVGDFDGNGVQDLIATN